LFVVAEVLTLAHRRQVLDFASQQRLPAMYEFGVFAREGGLMAYGPLLTHTFQRGAYYVSSILKGAKPDDLPVEQPTNFEPGEDAQPDCAASLLARADEVIGG